jgi:hypothetical protein
MIYPSVLPHWGCHGIDRHVVGNFLRLRLLHSTSREVRTNALSSGSQLCNSTSLPAS